MVFLATLEYLFWEFALLVLCARLASAILGPERIEESTEEGADRGVRFVTLAVLLNLLTACVVGTVVAFLRVNSREVYLGIAALGLGAVAARPPGLRATLITLCESLGRAARSVPLATRLLIAVLGGILLWVFLKPIGEWDSLEMLATMQDWLHNRVNPYHSMWHYVVFPELGYMPAMAITRDDRFFWVVSFKAPVLLALALYQIGIERRLPRSLAALAAFNLIAMFHVLPLGLPTIKNDMTHACGVVLFALGGLRIMRGKYDREAGVILAGALILLSIKYSGVLETAAALGLLGVAARQGLILHWRKVLCWTFLAGCATFLASGHYYVHNLWEYGNPLYPCRVKTAILELPGTLDLTGTSILENLRKPALWAAFFPTRNISPAGLWFPLVVAGCLIVLPLVMARNGIAALRKRPVRAADAFLAAFVFAIWMIYCRSFYSASSAGHDLVWVQPETLFSLRYVEGAIGLAEVFLLSLLALRCHRFVAYALVLTSLASRMFIAITRSWPALPIKEFYLIAAGSFALALATFWVAGKIQRPAMRRGLAYISVLLAMIVILPHHHEAMRKQCWPQTFRPVWRKMPKLPDGPVLFYTNEQGPNPLLYQFQVISGRFDRRFVPVTEDRIAQGKVPPTCYVVRVSDIYSKGFTDPKNELELRAFETRMEQAGYEKIASNRFCTLLRPAPELRVAQARAAAKIR
jgi:hypothetical protein